MPVELIELVRARVQGTGFETPFGGRGNYKGPCPICGGKDRFHVFPDQPPSGDLAVKAGVSGGYWCRQCDLSGDYIQWLVEVEGWGWTKIFEFLGVEGEAQTGLRPPKQRQPLRPRTGRELSDLAPVEWPPEKWREHAQKFVDESAANLMNNPHLIQWLERRGVPLHIAQAFGLGWHAGKPQKFGAPCSYRNREGWGLAQQVNPKTGRPKSIWIPRGLVIPNVRDGQLVSVRIRRPNSDVVKAEDDKYILLAGSNQKVCSITPGAKAYVVVEAALDGLAVIAAGVPDVGFCAMGTLTAYPDAQAAEWLLSAIDILNALDFEPQGKGETHGNKFRCWWMKRFEKCRRAPVPVGKDPGEFVEQAGLDGLAAWIRSQLSPVLKVTAPPPRGNVSSAPKSMKKKYQVPDDIERLRLLLATKRIELHVSMDSGWVFGADAPAETQGELAVLTHKPIVQRWLKEIGEGVVTGKNFMNPMEGKQ